MRACAWLTLRSACVDEYEHCFIRHVAHRLGSVPIVEIDFRQLDEEAAAAAMQAETPFSSALLAKPYEMVGGSKMAKCSDSMLLPDKDSRPTATVYAALFDHRCIKSICAWWHRYKHVVVLETFLKAQGSHCFDRTQYTVTAEEQAGKLKKAPMQSFVFL